MNKHKILPIIILILILSSTATYWIEVKKDLQREKIMHEQSEKRRVIEIEIEKQIEEEVEEEVEEQTKEKK